MKTDTIFYRLCQTAPGLLLELAGLDASQMSAYQFRSVEVKQTAFRMDGLLLPTSARSKRPVCFGEFQFQRDDDLHHRFFAEILSISTSFPKLTIGRAFWFIPAVVSPRSRVVLPIALRKYTSD